METYDLAIQLGSQVIHTYRGYHLAPHTNMRTWAAAISLKNGRVNNLIISGGTNFGVRYDDTKRMDKPNFSFSAFANAGWSRLSEAEVIKGVLVREHSLLSERIFPETMSATTRENACFVKILLERKPTFTGRERIAILTFLDHMERALSEFRAVGLAVEPLFAEDILAESDPEKWIQPICQYHSNPRGKRYPVESVRELLDSGQSVAELVPQEILRLPQTLGSTI